MHCVGCAGHKEQENGNASKDGKSFSLPAIVEAGAGLSMSKWKMTTSQSVSIRPASAARGGWFILVDGNMLLF